MKGWMRAVFWLCVVAFAMFTIAISCRHIQIESWLEYATGEVECDLKIPEAPCVYVNQDAHNTTHPMNYSLSYRLFLER